MRIKERRHLTRSPCPRILLVDADLELLGDMSQALELFEYEIDMAADCDEALWLFEQNPADLVVTDLGLPAKGGMEVIARIKRLRPTTKVIATSAGDRSGPDNELMVARYVGADETLAKPFAMEALTALAARMLAAA
jgi:DNA-binding response OmpR family regulator